MEKIVAGFREGPLFLSHRFSKVTKALSIVYTLVVARLEHFSLRLTWCRNVTFRIHSKFYR